MRTIAFVSIVAAAAALKESTLEVMTSNLESWFDADMDGEIDEEEYIDMMTYLDEDQYLTAEEEEWARDQWDDADPEDAIWLTDTISGSASGEGIQEDMDEAAFIELYSKFDLGYSDDELSGFFWDADLDGDGVLDIWEQDEVWYYLMTDDECDDCWEWSIEDEWWYDDCYWSEAWIWDDAADDWYMWWSDWDLDWWYTDETWIWDDNNWDWYIYWGDWYADMMPEECDDCWDDEWSWSIEDEWWYEDCYWSEGWIWDDWEEDYYMYWSDWNSDDWWYNSEDIWAWDEWAEDWYVYESDLWDDWHSWTWEECDDCEWDDCDDCWDGDYEWTDEDWYWDAWGSDAWEWDEDGDDYFAWWANWDTNWPGSWSESWIYSDYWGDWYIWWGDWEPEAWEISMGCDDCEVDDDWYEYDSTAEDLYYDAYWSEAWEWDEDAEDYFAWWANWDSEWPGSDSDSWIYSDYSEDWYIWMSDWEPEAAELTWGVWECDDCIDGGDWWTDYCEGDDCDWDCTDCVDDCTDCVDDGTSGDDGSTDATEVVEEDDATEVVEEDDGTDDLYDAMYNSAGWAWDDAAQDDYHWWADWDQEWPGTTATTWTYSDWYGDSYIYWADVEAHIASLAE